MKAAKIIKIVIWFLLYLASFNISLSMISAPNTIENVLGVFIFVIAIIITFETECFTKIKFKRNDKRTDGYC